MCREGGAEGRNEAHVLPREDQSHVSAEAEQRVVLLRLFRRRDLGFTYCKEADG